MRSVRSLLASSLALVALLGASTSHADGAPTLQRGRLSAPGTSLEDTALRVVREQVPAARGVELAARARRALMGGKSVVRLPQVHEGVPVLWRGATVRFAADGVAELVTSRLTTDLPDVAPAVSLDVARTLAAAHTGLPVPADRAHLAIWPGPDGARLVWVAAPPPVAALAYAPVVMLDARTGDVLLSLRGTVALNQAQVYPANPTKTPDLIDVTLPVGAGETTLQNALVVSENCIDQHTTKTVFGFTVHACELLQTAQPDANGDYLLPPGGDTDPEDAFSEITMFHHVNRAYDYFRTFDPELEVDPKVLTSVSNLRLPDGIDTFDLAKMADPDLPLVPFQNAFYAPADPLFASTFGLTGGAMWFGQGPNRDYSYDGDVVYHEFTHGVVGATLKLVGTPHLDELGASMSPGAMNEGLADYFSSAIAGDPDVGEYASQDFAPGAPAIRSLTAADACPAAIGGEVHQDATLFSAGLWDVRKGLAADEALRLDLAVFTAMNSSATGDLSYEAFAQLVLDAITASPLGQSVADALSAAWTARGILPQCTRILEFAGQPLTGPAELSNLWLTPGIQTTGTKSLGYGPGVVQVHVPLPEGTTQLDVSFTKVEVSSAGSVLGGPMGTPAALATLVRFGDTPVRFTDGPYKAEDGVQLVDTTHDGAKHAASVAVPEGVTSAYVMIVDTGDQDGAYTALSFATTQGSPTGAGGAGGAGSGATTATTGAGAGGDSSASPSGDGDCSCRTPGDAAPVSGLGLAGLLGLAALAQRRRARR